MRQQSRTMPPWIGTAPPESAVGEFHELRDFLRRFRADDGFGNACRAAGRLVMGVWLKSFRVIVIDVCGTEDADEFLCDGFCDLVVFGHGMNDPFELLCGNGLGIDEKLRVGVQDKLAEDGILLDSRDFRKRGLDAFLFDLRLQGGGAGIVRRIEEQRRRDAPRQMDRLAAAFDGEIGGADEAVLRRELAPITIRLEFRADAIDAFAQAGEHERTDLIVLKCLVGIFIAALIGDVGHQGMAAVVDVELPCAEHVEIVVRRHGDDVRNRSDEA